MRFYRCLPSGFPCFFEEFRRRYYGATRSGAQLARCVLPLARGTRRGIILRPTRHSHPNAGRSIEGHSAPLARRRGGKAHRAGGEVGGRRPGPLLCRAHRLARYRLPAMVLLHRCHEFRHMVLRQQQRASGRHGRHLRQRAAVFSDHRVQQGCEDPRLGEARRHVPDLPRSLLPRGRCDHREEGRRRARALGRSALLLQGCRYQGNRAVRFLRRQYQGAEIEASLPEGAWHFRHLSQSRFRVAEQPPLRYGRLPQDRSDLRHERGVSRPREGGEGRGHPHRPRRRIQPYGKRQHLLQPRGQLRQSRRVPVAGVALLQLVQLP